MGVDARDEPGVACTCGGVLRRVPSLPHVAPIPGIPNRLNRDWDEGDDTSEVIPTGEARARIRERNRKLADNKRRRREQQATGG